ncbi:CLUMA_CG017388, isoform A [Clunio marinus]|uniref:CLUMA_CG017388, isoform A n=1 Tax=Clunio marinus TaxID=568069 RepID=A0A1J1IX56_9DIPT|nr:CLUMA_CG017388, isoform A [Clunio marinus]
MLENLLLYFSQVFSLPQASDVIALKAAVSRKICGSFFLRQIFPGCILKFKIRAVIDLQLITVFLILHALKRDNASLT